MQNNKMKSGSQTFFGLKVTYIVKRVSSMHPECIQKHSQCIPNAFLMHLQCIFQCVPNATKCENHSRKTTTAKGQNTDKS